MLADAIALCDERFPEARGSFFAARLLVVRAWLRSAGGDGSASDLQQAWHSAGAAVPQLLRGQWRELEPLVWEALADGELDAPTAIGAIERGWPGGEALIVFMTHPAPAVRRLATAAAAASGRPDALEQLDRLERDADAEVALAARTAAGRIRRDPPPLSFVVLGGFALRRGSWNVPEAAFGRPIAARVLRFMLVHRGIAAARGRAVRGVLAGEAGGAARRNLAVTLSLIRRVLDPQGAEHSVIETSERAYRLVLRERDSLDSDGFERCGRRRARRPRARPRAHSSSGRSGCGRASRFRRIATHSGRRSGARSWSTVTCSCWARWPATTAPPRTTPTRSAPRASACRSTRSTRPGSAS